ncbi:hypothetical protein N7497_010430 [Penicillium chrysogenum]|nr:hypothetical protein N7497_010430 [Penicillium chrysogenum]
MKGSSLGILAILLQAYAVYGRKVEPDEVGAPGKEPYVEGHSIRWGTGRYRGSYHCEENETPFITPDKKHATCCLEGESLKGSADTEWHCCAEGHDVTGSTDVGYECCVKGSVYDGYMCKRAEKCPNGQEMVDGKCQCPKGQTMADDGTCKPVKAGKCDSGLKTGKCYFLTGRPENYLTFNGGQYSETKLSKYIRPAKFQLCRDEKCTPGLPVNPSDEVKIKDLHGSLPYATDANQWVDNKQNGAHIGKTPDYEKAGNFSFTKWPCGKYCLTGFNQGLSQACPDVSPGISFDNKATDSCIEFELLEVPCDIRADKNNCIWKNSKNQCCGKIDCPAEEETEEGTKLYCPTQDGTTRVFNGIEFDVICGKAYSTKTDMITVRKDVTDPETCYKECAANPKCQGANWRFSKNYCSHHPYYEDQPKTQNAGEDWVTFRPTEKR